MNKETYLTIADLKTIRLAVADKLAEEMLGEHITARQIALERVQDKLDKIYSQRLEGILLQEQTLKM